MQDIKEEFELIDVVGDDAVRLVCLEMRRKYLLRNQPENTAIIDELYNKAVGDIRTRQSEQAIAYAREHPTVDEPSRDSLGDSVFGVGDGWYGVRG